MRRELPVVPETLSAEQSARTARSIAMVQRYSGAIPWYPGGHTDPWDHVESAMGLTVAGELEAAARAYRWLRKTQRVDGSWPLRVRARRIEDPAADTNFCAYPAVGVWHYVLVTGDTGFAIEMWPMVRDAIDFVLRAQSDRGEINWAVNECGDVTSEALLSGCSSIHHSLRCALALANFLDRPQPSWEVALGRLHHVLCTHPEAFVAKPRYSMDWYYPILGGAVRGEDAAKMLASRWDDFVVDGLGIRCVSDHPWVTGAETCELVLSLQAVGEYEWARELFVAMQHLRDPDGSYWTGLVYADWKRWPQERTTWTSAAVLLAADALSNTTAGVEIFRGDTLPVGLAVQRAPCCELEYVT